MDTQQFAKAIRNQPCSVVDPRFGTYHNVQFTAKTTDGPNYIMQDLESLWLIIANGSNPYEQFLCGICTTFVRTEVKRQSKLRNGRLGIQGLG